MRASFPILVTVATLLSTTAVQGQTKPKRFTFKIDPKTPLADFLPPEPTDVWGQPLWLVDEPGKAREVRFQKAEKPMAAPRKAEESIKRQAEVIAKINFLGAKGKDEYLRVLCEHRPDLAGLPWIKGVDCQLTKPASEAFRVAVADVHGRPEAGLFTDTTAAVERVRTRVAALVQIHGIEGALIDDGLPSALSAKRELLTELTALEGPEATRALARFAVFAFDTELRRAALDELKKRPRADWDDVLLDALRYPLPFFANNAAQGVADLGRVDLVPKLIDLLDEPDPFAPRVVKPGKTPRIREVVRIHHNRNCLLCHAPATPDVFDPERDKKPTIVVGPITPPDLPLTRVYYRSPLDEFPDLAVRADVTYLRQDFSMLLPCDDSDARDRRERFDFLMRERDASKEEVASYEDWREKQGPKYVPPHHQAFDAALRRLTGRDAAAPTAAAWREALGLKR